MFAFQNFATTPKMSSDLADICCNLSACVWNLKRQRQVLKQRSGNWLNVKRMMTG